MSKSASSSQSVPDHRDVSSSANECPDDQEHKHDSDAETDDRGDDDAPHRDPELLERAYERFGTLDDTATYFDVSSTTIRKHLRKNDLYTLESETEDSTIRARDLENMNPEDVGLSPLGER